jgi:RNA polymerase sigma factor (TIGR02999 family)
MPPINNGVTGILHAIEQGDPHAAGQLLPLVYDELRKLAAQKLAHEKPSQTLEATGLVHEAYLRLVDADRVDHWDSRGHIFAAAAEAMRRILVENARRKGRLRHGGGRQRVDLLAEEVADTPSDDQVLLLDEALTRLANVRPPAAELVKLRFFSGLTVEEAAPRSGCRRAPPAGSGFMPGPGCAAKWNRWATAPPNNPHRNVCRLFVGRFCAATSHCLSARARPGLQPFGDQRGRRDSP